MIKINFYHSGNKFWFCLGAVHTNTTKLLQILKIKTLKHLVVYIHYASAYMYTRYIGLP